MSVPNRLKANKEEWILFMDPLNIKASNALRNLIQLCVTIVWDDSKD